MKLGVSANLRMLISRNVAEVGTTNLLLLLVLALTIFYPLFFGGFTTNDDAVIAINWGHHGNIFGIARDLAERQGRVGFFWGYFMLHAPYAVDSRIWYLAVKYSSFLLLLSALYYAVYQSFRSSWIALTSLVFFLAFIQNGWDHNALTSYPFAINFCATLFLASLGLFSAAIDRKNLTLAVISGGLYFFVLSGEMFVLFFPFYVAVLLSRGAPGESVIKRLMSGKKYILAVALSLMVYLAIYLAWRIIHPSSYDGNSLNGFNILDVVKVIMAYSLTSFPLASLHFILSPHAQLQLVNSAGLSEILSDLNATHFIKSAVAGFLFARLMTSSNFIVPKTRTLIIGSALTVVGIFLPNLLLGFTQKHQGWVSIGSYSYLYTYYSFISAVVFSALVLAYVNAKSLLWNPKFRIALISIGVIVVMVLSIAVEVRNQYIAFDQKLSHRKWQLMDAVIKTPAFMKIPDGSTVFAPTLSAHYRGIAQARADYWSMYVKYKTGKNVQFSDVEYKGNTPCYSLIFRQEAHSDNQFIVLAKIRNSDIMTSRELTIYSRPYQSRDVILGSFVSGDAPPKLLINGEPVANINTNGGLGGFASELPYVHGNGNMRIASLSGNVGIFQDQITISHYDVVPHLRPLSSELAEGIDFKNRDYPDFLAEVSGMSGYEPWGRWTDATGGPVTKFRFRQVLPRNFTLEIRANAFGPNYGEPVKVRVGNSERNFVIIPNNETEPYLLEFETDGTVNTLEIVPPKPTSPHEIDPKSKDPRKLGIGLISLKIKDSLETLPSN